MIFYEASIAQICVLFEYLDFMIVNGLLHSLGPRLPKYVLFKIYCRHWSFIDLWSFKYVLHKLYYCH